MPWFGETLQCFDMREICVLWNVEECPNWDKRFQGAVNAFLAYTDTQPSPELMDGMPTFLTKDGSYASDSASLLLATSWELENRKWTILTSELIRLKALLEETISNKEREILVLKREVKELEMIVERLKADLEAAKTARVLCKRALLKSGVEESNDRLRLQHCTKCQSEARKLKEKLLSQGDEEEEDYETQVEDLKLAIKATSYKYEKMLEDARHEIDVLLIYMCGGANQVRELESSVVD
ncbi:hypothetical protein Bca4012_000905 [Brassica carinata]